MCTRDWKNVEACGGLGNGIDIDRILDVCDRLGHFSIRVIKRHILVCIEVSAATRIPHVVYLTRRCVGLALLRWIPSNERCITKFEDYLITKSCFSQILFIAELRFQVSLKDAYNHASEIHH